MIFFFLSPFAFSFGNFFMPIQIGAKDLIFPRLNALSYWMYLAGGIVALLGFAAGGAAAGGWTMYVPLSLQQGSGVTFVAIGLILFVVGVTVSTINFIATFFHLRAPGMKMYHMPLFSWAIFWTVIIMLFAFPAIGAASLMLLMQRTVGFHYFDVANGGPLLWAHLFWFFGHPEVYILLLPGLGAVLEVIPTFAQRPLFGKRSVIWALAIATGLSFMVYVHHMFTTGIDPRLREFMVVTTEMISIPFGIVYLCMVGTFWRGNIRFEVPMLFAIGFIVLFLIGGLTGVFLSSVPIDYGMQGSYWVVAHFHYAVLGGGVWGVLAGLYYWFPKITGKMFNERWGRTHFWLGFVGFNLLFLTMFFYGKMPRRIFQYDETAGYNYPPLDFLTSSIGYVFAALFLVGLAMLVYGTWRAARRSSIAIAILGLVSLALWFALTSTANARLLNGFTSGTLLVAVMALLPLVPIVWGAWIARGGHAAFGFTLGFAGISGWLLEWATAPAGGVGPMSMLNSIASVGAYMFGLGIVIMLANFLVSLKVGARAGPDPWGGDSLEWTMSSPPPPENFTRTPVLMENPLDKAKRSGGAGESRSIAQQK
jgi:heme/copper-type cytochrome/quinol oxidase subunit 1